MKMLVLLYSGPDPRHITDLLDAAGVRGYTVLDGARGSGESGRVEGTRVWPGAASVIVSVVPADVADAVRNALRAFRESHPHGEHLHVATLPLESFV